MGKRLLEQKSRIDTERRYTPREALELLKELERLARVVEPRGVYPRLLLQQPLTH